MRTREEQYKGETVQNVSFTCRLSDVIPSVPVATWETKKHSIFTVSIHFLGQNGPLFDYNTIVKDPYKHYVAFNTRYM